MRACQHAWMNYHRHLFLLPNQVSERPEAGEAARGGDAVRCESGAIRHGVRHRALLGEGAAAVACKRLYGALQGVPVICGPSSDRVG